MYKISIPIFFGLFLFPISKTYSQVFLPGTNSTNFFNGFDVGDFATPTFVDIDNDGDYDAFVGTSDGSIRYYKNIGTKIQAQFVNEIAQNPLSSVSVGASSFPAFADVDGDGDKDLFVGSEDLGVSYFVNEGSATVANFVSSTSLLAFLSFDFYSKPALVDIDKDGDLDLFVGDLFGTNSYYKNIGTSTAPSFQAMPNELNPLASARSVQHAAPAFADMDYDGDFDFILGGSGSVLRFYQNTGSVVAANFLLRTGTSSPFSGMAGISSPIAAFSDIDNDGDLDLFIGGSDGQTRSFSNTTITLPLRLIAFTATRGNDVTIQWKTADEANTAFFHVEKSANGKDFTAFKTVPAMGAGTNNYKTTDISQAGNQYYRLRMFDTDGRYALSSITLTTSATENVLVKIFPNPVGEILQINLPNRALIGTTAEVLDFLGRVLQRIKLTSANNSVSLSHLHSGIYMLRMSDGNSLSFSKQ
jgi:hypothetical protein